MSEFIHVSEFLESSLCFTIPMLIAAQVFALKYQMWEPLDRINEQDYQADERWRENQQQYRGSTGNTQQDSTLPPNSVDRNIREQLINEPPLSEPTPVVEDKVEDQKVETDRSQLPPSQEPKPDHPYQVQNIQQVPPPSNEIVIEIANQPAPSTYPVQDKPYLKFYLQTNLIFNEYIPIIMCCMTLAILVNSTYILSMFCFFGYLFVNLIFNYAKLFEKLATKVENPLIPQIISNLAGIFLIAFFVGVFIRREFV